MSWTRWGSKCWNTFPHVYDCDLHDGPCPGSSVYVFESDRGFECCGCGLDGEDIVEGSFVCETKEEMKEHLRRHVDAGDHVRPSLLPGADLSKFRMRSMRSIMDELYKPSPLMKWIEKAKK